MIDFSRLKFDPVYDVLTRPILAMSANEEYLRTGFKRDDYGEELKISIRFLDLWAD